MKSLKVIRNCAALLCLGFMCTGSLVAQSQVAKDGKVANSSVQPSYVIQQFSIGQYTFPVRLPAGFELELLTDDLQSPRVIHFHNERLFIGSRADKLYWLDPPYDTSNVLAELPGYPHSVVVNNGFIYVARTNGVYSAPYDVDVTSLKESDFTLLVKLPGGRGHNSRTLKLAPDGNLYVSLGIAGNCSDQYLHSSYPEDDRRGGVFKIVVSESGAVLQPFAAGLRNPVGMDWHPQTAVLYASNNGPDHSGYNQPQEYFSGLKAGSFHGMPWYQFDGTQVIEDKCIESKAPLPATAVVLPEATFPARIAPMDLTFVGPKANATSFINDALVALHGSWATSNGGGDGEPASRRPPKIVRVDFDGGKVEGVSDFLSGFQLANGARWARPMGIAIGPDGDIYFTSDDGIHGLYRIRYTQ